MIKIITTLAHWLCSKGVNPCDITLVIRAKTDEVADEIEATMLREMDESLHPTIMGALRVRKMPIGGINLVITSLDKSAKV